MKLTRHFDLEEFTRSNTADKLRIYNTPTRAIVEWLKYGSINVLEPIRAIMNRPLHITSGYRSFLLNAKVGGAHNSQHLIGQAADIRIEDAAFTNKFLHAAMQVKFDQLILEHANGAQWLHISWSPTPRKQVII